MKKFFLVLIFMFLLVGGFFVFNNLQPYFQPKNGRLTVTVAAGKAKVYLDNALIGTSPMYAKDLPIGNHTISVELSSSQKQSYRWEGDINLSNKTLSVINLDLASSKVFSAGETLSFVPGQRSLSVITYPPGANVFVDNVAKGKAPLVLNLTNGVHQLIIKKAGYLARELTPNLEDGYKLEAVVSLAQDPFGQIKKLDSTDKLTLFQIIPQAADFTSQEWADAVAHLQQSFTSSQTKFDVLIDGNGQTFILDPTSWKNKVVSKALANIGYFAKTATEALSPKASVSWQTIKGSFN